MKSKLLLSTAVLALVIGAGAAGAQTTTDQTKPDQTKAHDRNGNPVRVIDTKRPGDNNKAETPAAASGNAATTASGSAAATTPAQSTSSTNQPAAATANQPSTAQSGQASPSAQPSTAQAPAPAATTNATTDTKANTANQPAAAQTTQPAAQQPSTATSAAPAQPNAPAANQAATNNAQPPVKLSATLQTEQKVKLTQAFTAVDMKPVTNVNFSLTVGTAVPRTVEFHPLPPSVVAIIPQYRGYNYILVRDEIVILEPGTSRIVDVIDRGGPSHARSTTTTTRSVNLSKQQRDYLRERSARRTTTTGSAPRTTTRRVMVGDTVPETVEIESFPEEVYREVPTVRSYRYFRGERGIYLVDPQRRVIIDDLDD